MTSSSTLRDVAELAGVSVGTASQALNNRPNVSTETRSRVLEAARALDYPIKAKDPASKLAESPLALVGMITKRDFGLPMDQDHLVNPFYSHIQMGVEAECRYRGINLMYANIDVDQRNRPIKWPIMLRDSNLDGLILMGMMLDETVEQIQKLSSMPIVLIDSYTQGLPFDQVLTDNVNGARMAVEHLISLGHRSIGLIGWNAESPFSVYERRAGYDESLQQYGLHPLIEESKMDRDVAVTAIKRLIRRNPEVTAVFACNDETAIGVILGAREMGLQVPEDLSVVGFDNINVAKDITPALSTINVSKYWMGSIGVRMLLSRAENPDQPRVTTVLSTNLVIRSSTAAPIRR